MHPDTKKAVSTPRRKHDIKKEHSKSLLSPSPLLVGGIPATLSNLSGSSGGMSNQTGAILAYERFMDDDRSVNSRASNGSQDTFSTYGGETNIWGNASTCIPWCKLPFRLHWKFTWPETVVKSRAFKRISITLILVHCVLCAIATSDFVTEDATVKYHFDLAKNVFVYIMSAELLIQFLCHGMSLFYHGWLLFDFFVICTAWAMPNLLIMRSFRIVRTLRLASWVKDLKQLVLALLLVIPKMFAIFFLLLILFVIFSILFTDLFKHTYADQITDEDYFGRLDTTLFTLFQIMTLDGWAEICKQIMTVYEWAWAPFLGFVVVSSFFFLNLVIAVVCEAVTSVHRDTVVKYIQDDISAVTSVREALKVDDRLEELAGSVQLMMQAQITVLETMQKQQMQQNQNQQLESSDRAPRNLDQEERLQKQKVDLQQDLDNSFLGTVVQSAAKSAQQRMDSVPENTTGGHSKDGSPYSGSIRLNPLSQEAAKSMPVEAPRQDQPVFNVKDVPTNPIFWASIGLTDKQISKVMQALQEQRIEIVLRSPKKKPPSTPGRQEQTSIASLPQGAHPEIPTPP